MVVERIKEYLDFKGLTIAGFEKSVGLSNAAYSKALKKGGAIGSDKVENILSVYTDLSPEWLLTGKGSMLNKQTCDSAHEDYPAIVAIPTDEPGTGIPLIPVEAMAGAFRGERSVMEYECEKYIIPIFSGADFLIRVSGDSMQPTFRSGDLVACQRVPLKDLFFQWGRVYVLDTAQGAIIKRIHKSDEKNCITAISDNTVYPAFNVPVGQLNGIALVKGLIRLE